MISRTRLIITALLACHLFLQPGLLTSQLRPSVMGETSEQAAPQPETSDSALNLRTPAENKRLSETPPVAQNATPPTPGISVITDTGQHDQKTEQIIQQELQTSSDQEMGPPRPAINVPLGRDEVLIRADEQEKTRTFTRGEATSKSAFAPTSCTPIR